METKELGRSGIKIFPIVFGGNVFGWTIDEKTSFEILDGFTDAGFNFIDTADIYSYWAPGNKGGESEKIIGNWIKKKKNRADVVIATKVGGETNDHGRNITKNYIIKTVEESLKRLQTDYIDLYQTHWDDNVTPVEETLSAYQQLLKEGKIRAVGASNLSPERLQASLDASNKLGLPRYETFQPCYNLYDREGFESELEDICLSNQLGVITYYSLASGFLSGKYRSQNDIANATSARKEGIQKYLNTRGQKILTILDEVAAEYDTTPATVSLAWLLARPSVTAPIVSATNLKQLESLIQAPQLQLSDDTIRILTQTSDWK